MQIFFCRGRIQFIEEKVSKDVLLRSKEKIEKDILPIFSQFAHLLQRPFLEWDNFNRSDRVFRILKFFDGLSDFLRHFCIPKVIKKEEHLQFLTFVELLFCKILFKSGG